MPVVVETRRLSPDARLPVGSEQAEQPGKSAFLQHSSTSGSASVHVHHHTVQHRSTFPPQNAQVQRAVGSDIFMTDERSGSGDVFIFFQEGITALAKVDLTSLTNPNFSSLTVSLRLFQNRRWSSAQAREFLHLHSTLALITLHADLTPQRTHGETRSRFSGFICSSFRLSLLLPLPVQHRGDSNSK